MFPVHIRWNVTKRDVKRVKKLVAKQARDPLVIRRAERTKSVELRSSISKRKFWRTMIHARLTTQQRSGRDTPIHNFVNQPHFPLEFETVCSKKNPDKFIAKTLKKWGGIRFYNEIGKDLSKNLLSLKSNKWKTIKTKMRSLRDPRKATKRRERRVASYIQQTFDGFGPKQSRNLLQMLGLTCHEVPIDSRLVKWLNNNTSFPIKLTAKFLAKKKRYEVVLDEVQKLCGKAKVSPCIFDAAVFVSQGERAQKHQQEQC